MHIDALNNIAVVFFWKKDYSEALEYHRKYLLLMPNVLRKKAEEAGLDESEIEQLQRKYESKKPFNIGECLFLMNDIDAARETFRKFIEKSGKFPHRDMAEVVEEILAGLQKKHR